MEECKVEINDQHKETRECAVRYMVEQEIKTGNPTHPNRIPSWFEDYPYYKSYYEQYKDEMLKSNKMSSDEPELSNEERIVFDALGIEPKRGKTEEEIQDELELKRRLKLKQIAEAHNPKSAAEMQKEYRKRRYEKLKSSDIPISSAFEPGEPVICPSCGGSTVSKSGYILKAREKRQRYLCKSCSYVFSERY